MNMLFFCTRWGYEHIPWDIFLRKVKDAGYDGVETSLPLEKKETDVMADGIARHNLKLIGQHWGTIETEFRCHEKAMAERLHTMASVKLLLITSHTGKDYYTFDQSVQLLEMAYNISLSSGVPVIHETHRGKFSFAAHITKQYLKHLPWLRLTLDVSNWFLVAESYLSDQPEAVELALLRTDHIHSRIGCTQHPQAMSHRETERKTAEENYLRLWDKVVSRRAGEGASQFTFTPEFGPYPYMSSQKFRRQGSDRQWAINSYMMNLLKERYKEPVRQ